MEQQDRESAWPPAVAVRCAWDPRLTVRLSNRQIVDRDETVFTIEALADGLHATIRDVSVTIWDRDGNMATFLQELADDFRGWAGQRTWRTSQLIIQATFHSGGHVELTWNLRPWTSQQASWQTSVTTWIEGRQQMTTLASDVREFVSRP